MYAWVIVIAYYLGDLKFEHAFIFVGTGDSAAPDIFSFRRVRRPARGICKGRPARGICKGAAVFIGRRSRELGKQGEYISLLPKYRCLPSAF